MIDEASGGSIVDPKELVINFTPDSYNSLINITDVLYPESTKAEVLSQLNEKKAILKDCLFKQNV